MYNKTTCAQGAQKFLSNAESGYLLQLFLIEFEDEVGRSLDLFYGWCLPVNERKDNSISKGGRQKKISGDDRKYRFREGKYYLSPAEMNQLFSPLRPEDDLGKRLSEIGVCFEIPMSSKIGWVRRPDIWLSSLGNDSFTPPYCGSGMRCSSLHRVDKTSILIDSISKDILGHLQKNTGISFMHANAGRLGNVERLHLEDATNISVTPVNLKKGKAAKSLAITMENDSFKGFLGFCIRMRLSNAAAVILDECKTVEREELESGITFDALEAISDFEVQVYGVVEGSEKQPLLFEERHHLLREICSTINVSSGIEKMAGDPKLEMAARCNGKLIPAVDALRVRQSNIPATSSRIKRDGDDPWRDSISETWTLIKNTLPSEKSEGRFFSHDWGVEGFIGFRQWLKEVVCVLPHQGEVFIVDPYFDTAGLSILMHMDDANYRYTVLMNSAKCANPELRRAELDGVLTRNKNLMKSMNLNIYDFSEREALHDRYIVLRNLNTHFHKGFHLSNSLQKACENHPLLITPIPKDVLRDVQAHLSDLEERGKPMKIWPKDIENSDDDPESQIGSRTKDVVFEDFKNAFAGLCAANLTEQWQYITDSVSNSNEALHYFWGHSGQLAALSDPLRQHISQIMSAEVDGFAADPMDLGYYEFFQEKPFSELLKTLVPEYMRRSLFPNYEIYWGLNVLIINNIQQVDELLKELSNQCYAKYYRMILCLIAELNGEKQIVFSAIQSDLPALRVVAIRLIFSFVHDGRNDYFSFGDLAASLSSFSSEEEMMSVAKFLSFCWDKNDRLSKDLQLKREEQKEWFLNRLLELWPNDLSEEFIRKIISLSDRPISGSASVDITNAYLIPLAEQGLITYKLIGSVWFELWFDAVKTDHLSLEFPQLNAVAVWYMTEHSPDFWSDIHRFVKTCNRILSHPLADLIDYQEAKKSKDALIKIASFLLLCRDAQEFDKIEDPPNFQWGECANEVLAFAGGQLDQARSFSDSLLEYYEKVKSIEIRKLEISNAN